MNKKAANSKPLKKLLNKVHPDHISIVNKAVEYSRSIHGKGKRLSGRTWVEHGLRVALNLAILDLDTNSIIVAILHHVDRVGRECKHSDLDRSKEISKEVKEIFGSDVYDLLKKFNQISETTKNVNEPEVINRYIFKRSSDLRVIFIRLADRLENARTLEYLPGNKQIVFAKKLLKIYSPLADYLNLLEYKREFENIGYKFIYPQRYINIDKIVKALGLEEKGLVDRVSDFLEDIAKEIFNEPVVFGRVKSFYSIHKKRKKYSDEGKVSNIKHFNDLLAFTVILENIDQCYEFTSLLTALLDKEVLKYEDYISNPKPNGFREIQLVVKISDISDIKIEVQVMTMEMYQHNTYGPASHFAYKSQETRYAKPSTEFKWIKEIREKINDNLKVDKSERSRPMYSNIFAESVFVWTPKEELVQLPTGATALDFAYKIHTEIGNRAMSAYIDGKKYSLSKKLKSGQVVKINTNKNLKSKGTVKREWLKWCVTDRARDSIRDFIKNY